MAQTTKFIDITRTFLPVDPNSFPETLHNSGREDSPEHASPVMAYKGYNFLPTSYGYKSYFGTNQLVGIDALAARVDYVFIYQNLAFENVLIALCDTGIWTKVGSISGAWINSVPIIPNINPNVHMEWTFTIIANVLYAYQQGQPSYQKIVSAIPAGVTITSIVPNFLNMAAQLGAFRANGRLAFWDSDDSISWANLDDFADFEPSLETLAGNVKFSAIQGRIVTILPHGPGFMVYSTKSIVYVAQDIANLYQWNPMPVLPSVGISYPRQVAVGSPDTLHFAYTQEGMKKIDHAKEETIVTEVTDFLKDSSDPIYLRIVDGRFLFVELLDKDLATGVAQLSTEDVPPVDYTFPGSGYTLEGSPPQDMGAGVCSVFAGINDGLFTDTQPLAPLDQKIGSPVPSPVWVCYLSKRGVVDPANIVWEAAPCPTLDPNGVDALMSPGSANTLDKMTQDSSNKVATTGAEAYVDGNWTIERFIQTQNSIWLREQQGLRAYVSAISNRSKTAAKTVQANICTTGQPVRNECLIGRYPTEFSVPVFGWSKCSFWLTRYAIAAIDLIRTKANISTCDTGSLWNLNGFPTPTYTSAAAVLSYAISTSPDSNYSFGAPLLAEEGYIIGYKILSNGLDIGWYAGVTHGNTDTMYAYNKGVDVDILPTPESPYCEIVGWNYTKEDGTTGYIAATGTCEAPSLFPSTTKPTAMGAITEPRIDAETGALCGKPFESALVDGVVVDWPSTNVTIPAGSFLLQQGSIAPIYPTFEGALVYDLQLKKWGKMKLRYKQLVDYSPVNSTAKGLVPTTVFGIMSGVLRSDGKISLFDMYPTKSYISYGKIGYDRKGNTTPEEVRVDFRIPCTGYVKTETSLHGQALSTGFTKTEPFTSATAVTLYGAYPGRWSNIEIGGIFDISYLEYTGYKQGRR